MQGLRRFSAPRARGRQRHLKQPKGFTKAELRLKKDLEDIFESKFVTSGMEIRLSFPNGNSRPSTFLCKISIHKKIYAGSEIDFVFNIPPEYPYRPPNVHCITPTYHPNFDNETGAVGLMCINDDWTPALTLNHVILGLQQLLLHEPNDQRVLNMEAAHLWATNPVEFEKRVQRFALEQTCARNQPSSSSPNRQMFMTKRKKRSHSSASPDNVDDEPALKKFRCEDGGKDARFVFEESKTQDFSSSSSSTMQPSSHHGDDGDWNMTSQNSTATHVDGFGRSPAKKRRFAGDSPRNCKRQMTSFAFDESSPMHPRHRGLTSGFSFPPRDDSGDIVMETV